MDAASTIHADDTGVIGCGGRETLALIGVVSGWRLRI